MPCYHPIEVMLQRKNLPGDPEYKVGWPQVVPCGSCIGCRAEQSRQWAVRMMHESRLHSDNVFITLTYKEIPGNGEVVSEDFSRFIKRLRKTQERRISFYGCGEYGGKNNRPHYHALLFGITFLDRASGFDSTRPDVWRSETLEDIWGRGLCEGGSVTMASASYVSGYITKKRKQKDNCRADPFTGELLKPEFARMSLRPAIGRNWIEKYWTDVYPRDFVVIDGHEAKPPRYYDKYMSLEDDKGGSAERRELMETVKVRRYDDAIEKTKYQLMAGEKIAKSRANLFSRRDRV